MRQTIVDCNFTLKEILRGRQQTPAPNKILKRQRLVDILYYSFDKKLHKGQIVVDVDLIKDVKEAFDLIRRIQFPIQSVIPLVDRRFMLDDDKSMSLNNSSGFNYRTIAGTLKLSNHAFGRAIDINPFLNPYIRDFIQPEGAKYDPMVPGTLTKDCEIVNYMHFEKPL